MSIEFFDQKLEITKQEEETLQDFLSKSRVYEYYYG